MNTFYDHYRSLYELMFGDHASFAKGIDVDDRESALAESRDCLRAFLAKMETDRATASEAGRDTRALTREINRAIFLKGAITDLLIAYDDNRASISASSSAIDAAGKQLKAIADSSADLNSDLGNVSSALDAVARLLNFVG
ncbi:hypothetical protein U1708_07855 [Sphingomonas sp. ZB1N12]|uniref:hypothetical protein n=1 Tax=Sphingomonas arabinosi TaxID=3096160 RepID=UPI002FC6B1D1